MKKLVAVVLFLLLLCGVYMGVDSVLSLKLYDAESPVVLRMMPEDSVDVLFVGSSHVGMNVDNRQLYESYGIASHSLWMGMQPLWNSYYYVREGLQVQTPDVVVVETFLTATTADYSTQEVAMKNVRGLRHGWDRINAALESFSTWTEAAEALWGLPYYHTRFDELSSEDFNYNLRDQIYEPQSPQVSSEDAVSPLQMLDYESITDELPLTEKNERYLRLLIDLCRSRDVELVLLISPYQATEEEAMRLRSVERIAEENGVRCINGLTTYQDMDIDPAADFYDIGHLNLNGIVKFTDALGQYLTEAFTLPDRRTDETHVWNLNREDAADSAGYALSQTFLGDGIARCEDTGLKLYDNRFSTWTLLTRLDMNAEEGDVYLSCFDESNIESLSGILIRKGAGNSMSLLLGPGYSIGLPEITGDTADIAVVKQSENYTVYVNGECCLRDFNLPTTPYSGSLLIGCQELSAGGEKFRFGKTHVLNLEVYQSALDEGDIVSWQPEALPEAPPALGRGEDVGTVIYTLPEQFLGGDGSYRQASYVDTQLRLFEEASTAWTLFARVTPGELSADNVYFSCFSEEENAYRGLLVRQSREDSLTVIVGSNYAMEVPCTTGRTMDIALVKDGAAYRVYVDGALAGECETACEPYAGTLLVGCQVNAEGEIFRRSQTTVNSLSVVSGALDPAQIAAFEMQDAPLPEKRVATSVAYTLPDAFIGNGTDRMVDTGVCLYDAPQKDWTLETTLTISHRDNYGPYISCFSEEENNYRGFMIREDAAGVLTVWVGTSTLRVTVPENETQVRLVLVKSGSQYTLYSGGTLAGQVQSACAAYDGHLLVGCQQGADGDFFRFSRAKVDALDVLDGALSAEQALEKSELSQNAGRFAP